MLRRVVDDERPDRPALAQVQGNPLPWRGPGGVRAPDRGSANAAGRRAVYDCRLVLLPRLLLRFLRHRKIRRSRLSLFRFMVGGEISLLTQTVIYLDLVNALLS